jgi:hypothetical protein
MSPSGALGSSEFKLKSGINGAPLRATPHLFRFELELASAPRSKVDRILFLIIARSFLARKIKTKTAHHLATRLQNTL